MQGVEWRIDGALRWAQHATYRWNWHRGVDQQAPSDQPKAFSAEGEAHFNQAFNAISSSPLDIELTSSCRTVSVLEGMTINFYLW
jgi:hypothetical protein